MMLNDPSLKYRPFPQVDLPNRQWPSKVITAPPRWLSTDMRDGNQSLIAPMNAEQKRRFFDLPLTHIGTAPCRARRCPSVSPPLAPPPSHTQPPPPPPPP